MTATTTWTTRRAGACVGHRENGTLASRCRSAVLITRAPICRSPVRSAVHEDQSVYSASFPKFYGLNLDVVCRRYASAGAGSGGGSGSGGTGKGGRPTSAGRSGGSGSEDEEEGVGSKLRSARGSRAEVLAAHAESLHMVNIAMQHRRAKGRLYCLRPSALWAPDVFLLFSMQGGAGGRRTGA